MTGTSGLPDDEQGLATGLTSMTQQVGHHDRHPDPDRRSRPAQAAQLTGIHLALIVNVVVTLISVAAHLVRAASS